MNIIDWILYIPLALCVCYLLVYAVASKFYRAPCFPEARKLRRFVILFPAYKEDRSQLSAARLSTGAVRHHCYFRPDAGYHQ